MLPNGILAILICFYSATMDHYRQDYRQAISGNNVKAHCICMQQRARAILVVVYKWEWIGFWVVFDLVVSDFSLGIYSYYIVE